MALIHTKESGQEIAARVMDPNFAKTPSHITGTTLVEDYLALDLYFYTEINNDIALGHQRIKDLLKYSDTSAPGLYVTKNCTNMIRAFENYVWEERDLKDPYCPRERPGEAYKDMIDAVRYLLDYNPQFFERKKRRDGLNQLVRNSITGY